jgi:hypothetical protein
MVSVVGEQKFGPHGFLAVTPTGAVVACAASRWDAIVEKHPVLAGLTESVRETIAQPDEIRRSRWDPRIWLCYRRRQGRLLCAVIAPESGTLVTAYPTDSMKAGEVIWTRSE